MFKKIFFSVLFLIICALIFDANLYLTNSFAGWFCLSLYLVNYVLSAHIIIRDKRPYSVNQFFGLFNLIFFCFIPVVQIYLKTFPWETPAPHIDLLLEANVAITLSLLTYIYVYPKKQLLNQNRNIRHKFSFPFNAYIYYFLFIPFLGCCAYILITYGFSSLFIRSDINEVNSTVSEKDTTQVLLVGNLTRTFMLAYLLMTIEYFRQRKISFFYLLFIAGLAVLFNFPTSLTRFFLAIFYFGFIITAFGNYNLVRKYFMNGVIVALITIFPILTLFRYLSSVSELNSSHLGESILQSFTGGDYDAYLMLCNTFKYVERQSATWGYQFLSSILFFVPRGLWPTKGYPSGQVVGQSVGYSYLNLSEPYNAEGLINFSYLGILIFAALFAYVYKKIDQAYWSNNTKFNFVYFLYPSYLGASFIILRGPLLSSLAPITALTASGFIMLYLNKNRFFR